VSDSDEATLAAEVTLVIGDVLLAATAAEPTTGVATGPRGAELPAELPEVDRERYTVGEHVASGGGGRIHVAHDRRLGRTVALKRLRPTRDRTAQDRFVREALLTARLQHPGIVPVYEAGRWPDGDPFYAMKLVSGQPLSRQVEVTRSLAERLALLPHVLDVAEAIAYAHSRGVIHRDLKPANVLVGSFGETVVIDWGLGKELGDEASSERLAATPHEPGEGDEGDGELTRAGAVMGTPIYMPPEQARGEPVGPAADVYSLGAILYHVLAGRPPYERGSGLEVLGRVLLGPPPPLTELEPRVPRELAAIVAKAMAREPGDRYPTAAQLAEDLRRYQTGQIVGAHRYTAGQRLRRWAWRYRTAVTASAAALLVLAIGGAIGVRELQDEVARTLEQYGEAKRARADAMEARDGAMVARDEAVRAHEEAEEARGKAVDRADALLLERARVEAPRQPNEALGCLSQISGRFGEWSRVQVIASDAAAHGLASVLRDCQAEAEPPCVTGGARRLMSGPGAGQVDVLRGDGRIEGFDSLQRRSLGLVIPAQGVQRADRRGATMVTFDEAGELRRWDVPSQTSERLGRPEAPLSWVSLASEHDVLGLEAGGDESRLWHWAADGSVRLLATCTKEGDQVAPPVAVSSGGRWAGCADYGAGQLTLVELGSERTLDTPLEALPRDVAVDDDATWVAWPERDEALMVWDVKGGRRLRLDVGEGRFEAAQLAFVPGSSRLVVSSYEGSVATWVPGQRRLVRLSSHEAMVSSLAVAADGQRVATAAVDGTLHVYELASGRMRRLEGMAGAGIDVELLPDHSAVVALALDHSMYAWPMTSAHGELVARLPQAALLAALDPTGEWLAVGGKQGGPWLVPVSGVGEPRLLEGLRSDVRALAFTADGQAVAAGCDAGMVGVWTLDGERRWLEDLGGSSIRGLGFTADDEELAVAAFHEGALRFEAATGRRRAVIEGKRIAGLEQVAGDRLLVWSYEGWVGLWARDGTELLRRQLADEVWVARASPAGDALFVGGRDGRLRRLSVPSGEEVVAASRDLDVVGIELLDGGARVLTNSNDQSLRLWDGETLALERTFEGHRGHVGDLAVGEGRPRAVSAGHDGAARVWDLVTGESRELLGHQGAVTAVVLSLDGRTVLTTGDDGTVRRWPDDVPDDEAGLRQWLDRQLVGGR
jgi:WD40 repeat protein